MTEQSIQNLARHPGIAQQLLLVRVIWAAMLVSGTVIFFVLPPMNVDLTMIAPMPVVLIILSFVLPNIILRSQAKVAAAPESPEFIQKAKGTFLINRVLAFAMTEGAYLQGIFAFDRLDPNARGALLAAYIFLLAIHFPTEAKFTSVVRALVSKK